MREFQIVALFYNCFFFVLEPNNCIHQLEYSTKKKVVFIVYLETGTTSLHRYVINIYVHNNTTMLN